ncbi:MAG: hypothetical protein QOK47_1094 [Actinomycetota bacterium]|jgi:uncharacterized protein YkwD|nr:hypothetical protein [Actinomycetota bacterium]
MVQKRWTWIATLAVVSVLILFLQVGAAMSAVRPSVSQAPPWPKGMAPAAKGSSRCWNPKESELGFTQQINEARLGNERGKLRLDPELSKTARVHTREMVDLALLHHTSSEALGHRVTRWRVLGENVGVGNTVDTLHHAFMASPPHRANIMHTSFRYVGVGVAEVGGRMWVTVIFENRVDPGTSLHMRSCNSRSVILKSPGATTARTLKGWLDTFEGN